MACNLLPAAVGWQGRPTVVRGTAADAAAEDAAALGRRASIGRTSGKETAGAVTPAQPRFDAPAGQFGVQYLGKDEHCAFIEAFGHATGIRFVDRAELSRRSLARIMPKRPLRPLDLSGKGLGRLGADARITTGESYDPRQSWAKAIHDHPQKPDGIV